MGIKAFSIVLQMKMDLYERQQAELKGIKAQVDMLRSLISRANTREAVDLLQPQYDETKVILTEMSEIYTQIYMELATLERKYDTST